MKKRIVIRIAFILMFILFGIILYITGKEHKILIDNKDISINGITYAADIAYTVWVDDQEIGMIEKGKRKVAMVVGASHKIVVEENKDVVSNGERYEKIFKLKTNENAIVNLPAMVNDANEWIDKQN